MMQILTSPSLVKASSRICSLLLTALALQLSSQVAAQDTNLDARMQEVADTLAIQKLLGQYMHYVDAREFTAYADLFAEDGELIFQANRLQGRKAIFELMSGSGRTTTPATPRPTLVHTMSNSLILIDGANATHEARWINMSPDAQGLPTMRGTGLYQDVLRKIDGQWKFQKRVVTNDIPFIETQYQQAGPGSP